MFEFLEDESGQGTLEYILILAATITGSIILCKQILMALDKGILKFGAQLEKDLKTGRASLGTWKN
jgi:hypothetical protein